ncbi:hypothetical protein GCM10008090_03560 [Arenicella chitinivorans]|uniref:OmpA-like domain-containing protein n=1 Tax=Arenicella chitinivorans TaxID=1329800 RepID=A0A918VHK8_9GAMM|nr:OmpA family protein [Arenicella chitinivorans]GGZ98394.1 hypothetical protein GCM10008090_03560 [Arenicella chitinivorans]
MNVLSTRVMLKLYLLTAIAILSLTSLAQACATFKPAGAELFKHVDKHSTVAEVIQGPVEYFNTEQDGYSVGYRPVTSVKMQGSVCHQVYDFDEQQSAYSLFQQAKTFFSARGQTAEFECQGTRCGETTGWQIFFDKSVAGPTENQYYLLSTVGNGSRYLVANMVHVTEFDGRPRMILRSVYDPALYRIPGIPKPQYQSPQAHNIAEVSLLSTVYFDTGSSASDNAEKLSLISEQVKLNGDDKTYVIVGFTDSAGDAITNLELSRMRAHSTMEQLKVRSGLAAQQFIAWGAGEIDGGQQSAGRARRADIYVVQNPS